MHDVQNFPSFVCKNCYDVINMCYNFSLVCQQSEFSLRDCYQKTLFETKEKLNSKKEDLLENSIHTTESDTSSKINVVSTPVDLTAPDSILKTKEFTLIDDKKEQSNIKKQKIFKSVSKPSNCINIINVDDTIGKYPNTDSLAARLKEVQSKLENNIARSNDLSLETIKNGRSNSHSNEDKLFHKCPQFPLKYKHSDALKHHSLAIPREVIKLKSIVRFQCKKCSKSFLLQEKLISHYKTVHNQSDVTEDELNCTIGKSVQVKKNKFYCFQCIPNSIFSSENHLLNHIKESHQESKKAFIQAYSCNQCDSKPFASKLGFNIHIKTAHNLEADIVTSDDTKGLSQAESNLNINNLFVCTTCSPDLSFTNFEDFMKHREKFHEKQPENISPMGPTKESGTENEKVATNNSFKVSCKNCHPFVEFNSTSLFVNHMNTHHHKVGLENWEIESKPLVQGTEEELEKEIRRQKWKCTECPAVYFRRHSLYYHMKEKHKKPINFGAMKCPDCEESFYTNRQLIQHGITVHQKYFAHHHKIFKKKILQPSSEEDNRIKNFECDICQKKYVCKNSLKRHILKSHLGRSEAETVVCPHCGKTLSNKLNLKSHIEFIHEALFVCCPICKKKINFKTIGKHYKTHQTESDLIDSASKFLCNLCGKILKSKRGFEDHQKLHKNIRDQLCDVCGSGFTTKKFLYLHKKTHEGMKRKVFGCPQCEKVFSGRHTLNRHLLTHSGEKNFICEICSKCFYTLQELNRHVRYHKKEYRFDCQLCEKRFLDKSRFRHHMMRHRNIRPHKCQFCDKMFIVRRKMNLHMAAKHNVQVQSTKVVWKDPKTYIPLDDLL